MVMTHIHHMNRYVALGLIPALFSGLMLFGLVHSAEAAREDRPTIAREERPAAAREARPAEAREVRPAATREARPAVQRGEFRDDRYNHGRVYPTRGQVVRALPIDHRVVVHGGARYYFNGGVWYRPQGSRFAIVAPPIGLFVPFLPPYYATIWVSGRPYYYANEVYYTGQGNGYVVAEQPRTEIIETSPPTTQAFPAPPIDQLFIYPSQNQSEQHQSTDRYECHRWAVSQTGFDPTQPPGGVPENLAGQKRADYQRAMTACLEGRGYTVR
jgi:hypothetical protein